MKKWKVWQPRLPRLVYPDWLGTGGFSHLWLWLSFVSSCLQYCRTSLIILDTSSMNLAACTITECLETKSFSYPSGWLLCCSWIGLMLFFSPCTVYVCFTFYIAFTLDGHRWNTQKNYLPLPKVDWAVYETLPLISGWCIAKRIRYYTHICLIPEMLLK